MPTTPSTTADRIARLARLAFGPADGGADARSSALGLLRDEHAAWARADLERFHPSWLVRALKGESPAVRRTVAANAPGSIAETLTEALGLSRDDLVTDHSPHPDALASVLTLWSERLIGGPPPRDDEPEVISAVAGSDRVERRRLFDRIGLAKWAYATSSFGDDLRPADRAHLDHFRAYWGEPEPRLAHIAGLDLRAAGDPRVIPAKLALITIGRLLADVDPARARWTSQHLPYDAAKWARLHGDLDSPVVPRRALLSWESRILAAARQRLDDNELGASS